MSISTAHYEVAGWPRERHRVNYFSAIRVLKCAWDDRFTLKDELSSYPDNLYPYNTATQATVVDIKVTPWPKGRQSQGTTENLADYEFARLIVEYSTQGPQSANLLTERLVTRTETHRVDHTSLSWSNAQPIIVTPDEAPIRSTHGLTYIIKRYSIPAIPNYVYTMPGYVNSNNYTSTLLGKTFPAGTLLYAGSDVQRTITMAGITYWQVEDVFHYAYNGGGGWNYAWRTSTMGYAPLYLRSNGNRYYWYPTTVF